MNKNKSDLPVLEKKREVARAALNKLDDQIENLRLERELPVLRKTYNDTYWVRENGYNLNECWDEYVHIVEVTGLLNSDVIANYIALDCFGEVRTGKSSYLSDYKKQITRKQFEKEKNKIIKRIMEL
jgi:hypothetical protein